MTIFSRLIFLSLHFLSFQVVSAQQNKAIYTLDSYFDDNEKLRIFYPHNWNIIKKEGKIFLAAENKLGNQDNFGEVFSISKLNSSGLQNMKSLLKDAELAFKDKYKTDGKLLQNAIKKNKSGATFGIFKTIITTHGIQILATEAYFQKNKSIYILSFLNDNISTNRYADLFTDIIDRFQMLPL